MALNTTIERLAEVFPNSAYSHWDIKKVMPEEDAIHFLNSGFIDCTYSNDECATYYLDKHWGSEGAPTIAVVLVADEVCYIVCDPYDQEVQQFKDINAATTFYQQAFGV